LTEWLPPVRFISFKHLSWLDGGKSTSKAESLPPSVDNSPLTQIVRRQLHRNGVTGQNSDVILAHFSGYVRGHNVPVLELYSKRGIG